MIVAAKMTSKLMKVAAASCFEMKYKKIFVSFSCDVSVLAVELYNIMKGVASFLQYLAEINAEVTILYNF